MSDLKNIVLVSMCLLFIVQATNAQDIEVPSDQSHRFAIEFGAGMGGYYGVLGTRVSLSGNLVGADIGLGFGPLASGLSLDISSGISLYLKNRSTPLRPKASLLYSRIGYTLNVMEEMSVDVSGHQTVTSEILYQENFSGVGLLVGVDWSLGKRGKICINLDLGYVYPFAGYEEIKQINEEKVTQLRSEGHIIEDSFGMDKITAFDFVDFSFGIGYALGRR